MPLSQFAHMHKKEKHSQLLDVRYLHSAAGLSRSGYGPTADAEEGAVTKAPRKHTIHMLVVDGERIPGRAGDIHGSQTAT